MKLQVVSNVDNTSNGDFDDLKMELKHHHKRKNRHKI